MYKPSHTCMKSTNFNFKDKIAVLAQRFPASSVTSNLDIYLFFLPIYHVMLGTPLCLRAGVQDPFHAKEKTIVCLERRFWRTGPPKYHELGYVQARSWSSGGGIW